ncbi:MAG: Rrf2 family transcriptional regulator [Candidatus Sericytochromatia bacterium]
MKISALQEYSLRCLLQLTKNGSDKPMSADEISKKELLSSAYVEKILQKLAKAGFVKSIRGTKGGYVLTEDPKNISIGSLMRVIDGSPMSEMCGHFSGTSEECTHISGCSIRPLWTNIYKYIYAVLDKTSLYDLLKEEENIAVSIEEKFMRSLETQLKV